MSIRSYLHFFTESFMTPPTMAKSFDTHAWFQYLRALGSLCALVTSAVRRRWFFAVPVWFLVGWVIWGSWLDRLVLGPAIVPISVTPVQPETRPGGSVTFRWVYEVFRDCPRDVELWLHNGRSVLLRSHKGSTAGRGVGRRDLTVPIDIPTGQHPGTALLVSIAHSHCTPFDTQTMVFTAPITILP